MEKKKSEYRILKEEVDRLETEYAEAEFLYMDIDFCEKETVIIEYLSRIGDLEYNESSFRHTALRLRYEIDLIQKNRAENIEMSRSERDKIVTKALKSEPGDFLAAFYHYISPMPNNYFNLTSGEKEKQKDIMKQINLLYNSKMKKYESWCEDSLISKAWDTYKNYDTAALKDIYEKAKIIASEVEEKFVPIEKLRERKEYLETWIEKYYGMAERALNEYPYNRYSPFLEDSKKMAERRAELESSLAMNIELVKVYSEKLNKLLSNN